MWYGHVVLSPHRMVIVNCDESTDPSRKKHVLVKIVLSMLPATVLVVVIIVHRDLAVSIGVLWPTHDEEPYYASRRDCEHAHYFTKSGN